MALYAYRDKARKNRVTAQEVKTGNAASDKTAHYYCINPDCEADMLFREETSSRRAHFGAYSSRRHMQGCVYSKVADYNPNSFDEERFDFLSAINNMLNEKKSQKEKSGSASENAKGQRSLTTLKSIHAMLKYYPPDRIKGGRAISEMLLDERSVLRHLQEKQVLLGRVIVEARVVAGSFYNKDERRIDLVVENANHKILITVFFEAEEVFRNVLNKIFSEKDRKGFRLWHIVVAGAWQSVENKHNCFRTTVKNKKQVYVL